MSELILKEPITGPAAWLGSSFAHDESWIHRLTADEISLIDAAVDAMKSRGRAFPDLEKGDFPIDALAPLLARWSDALENGRGFLLVRGLPLHRYREEDAYAICYGLGLHMGLPVCQNPRGDLLGEVMAVGDINDKHTRVYQTNLYLPYHSDPSDVVGLMCLRMAKAGGLSSLVSSASIYNRILAEHREMLGLYYKPMWYAHLGEGLPGRSPIFSYHEGKLSCRYLRQYIELGHELREQPLSRVEVAALDVFDSIMMDPSMRIDMMLEPGDIQFANNYAVLHSRTSFEDHDAQQLRRKMLRLWLKMPNARALAPEFPGRNGFERPSGSPGVGAGLVA